MSKRKNDKPGERRALEFDVDKSLTHVSKCKTYKKNGQRITKCFSKKNISSSVSSHTTIHVTEFCDQEYPESQLSLCSTSQSTSHLAYDTSSKRNPISSELQPSSGNIGCLLSPDCPDEKLTEKENQIDIKSLSNISKYEKFENHSEHNKDAMKDNAEANGSVVLRSNKNLILR